MFSEGESLPTIKKGYVDLRGNHEMAKIITAPLNCADLLHAGSGHEKLRYNEHAKTAKKTRWMPDTFLTGLGALREIGRL